MMAPSHPPILYLVHRTPYPSDKGDRMRAFDVRPYLARASVVVVPLHRARGLQNKILEALTMGKAVLTSTPALEGLRGQNDMHLLAAATVPEWVARTPRLLDDPELRRRLGFAGRSYMEEHHACAHCLAPMAALLGLPAEANQPPPPAFPAREAGIYPNRTVPERK
jgi:hypothetical protein